MSGLETVEDLVVSLVLRKREEAEAKEARIKAEEALLACYSMRAKERKTVNLTNGLKFTLETGISYKLEKGFPEGAVPLKKPKAELDEKAYEEMRENNPAAFAAASKYVTTSPKKASVTVAIK
jgi:hypothetical protein